jgi:hypothetical protein
MPHQKTNNTFWMKDFFEIQNLLTEVIRNNFAELHLKRKCTELNDINLKHSVLLRLFTGRLQNSSSLYP